MSSFKSSSGNTLCNQELQQNLSKQQSQLQQIKASLNTIKVDHLNSFSFYKNDLEKIKQTYSSVLHETTNFLQQNYEETENISYPLLKGYVSILKNLILQIAQTGKNLNSTFTKLEESIKSNTINQKISSLFDQIKQQQEQLKKLTDQQRETFVSNTNLNINDIGREVDQINKQISNIQSTINQETINIFQQQSVIENLSSEIEIAKKEYDFLSSQQKQCEVQNQQQKLVKQQQPLCIIIFDQSDYMQYHNQNFNQFLPHFIENIKQSYQNQCQIYNTQLNQCIMKFSAHSKKIFFGYSKQNNSEYYLLNQIMNLSNQNKNYYNIDFFLICSSNYCENVAIDKNQVKKVKTVINNNHQNVQINIIDTSIVQNFSTLTKLYLALQNEEFICALAQYNILMQEGQQKMPERIRVWLNSQIEFKKLTNSTIHHNSIQIQMRDNFIEKTRDNKTKLMKKQQNLQNDLQQAHLFISESQEKMKGLKEQLRTLQNKKDQCISTMMSIKQIQHDNLNEYAQILSQLGLNNEMFMQMADVDKTLKSVSKEFIEEKEKEKDELLENIYRLMKYLNTIITSLNYPQNDFTSILTLQLYMMNSKEQSLCLDNSLVYMLNELVPGLSDSFSKLFENSITFSDILNDESGKKLKKLNIDSEDKKQIQVIVELIDKNKMKDVLSVQKIRSVSKLIKKMNTLSELLESEFSS